MTENADVEWLRKSSQYDTEWVVMSKPEARRLLAHIDHLELLADMRGAKIETLNETLDDTRRPTVHEIAAQNMQGIMARGTGGYSSWQDMAVDAYDAAEALVAVGRRRDGL